MIAIAEESKRDILTKIAKDVKIKTVLDDRGASVWVSATTTISRLPFELPNGSTRCTNLFDEAERRGLTSSHPATDSGRRGAHAAPKSMES